LPQRMRLSRIEKREGRGRSEFLRLEGRKEEGEAKKRINHSPRSTYNFSIEGGREDSQEKKSIFQLSSGHVKIISFSTNSVTREGGKKASAGQVGKKKEEGAGPSCRNFHLPFLHQKEKCANLGTPFKRGGKRKERNPVSGSRPGGERKKEERKNKAELKILGREVPLPTFKEGELRQKKKGGKRGPGPTPACLSREEDKRKGEVLKEDVSFI